MVFADLLAWGCLALGLALMFVLLGRKKLLVQQAWPTALTLLLSLGIVLPLLFVFFTYVGLGFKGKAYETGMSLLILALGLGLALWGWLLSGFAARLLIMSGIIAATVAVLSVLP